MRPDFRREPETPVVDFESRRDASGDEPRADALDAMVGRLAEIAASLQQLIDVQFARARAEVREKMFNIVGAIFAGVLLIALTVTACIHLLRGLSGLTNALLAGLPWAGDLVAGVVGLLIVLMAGLICRAGARRANLRRMREKFQEEGR
jgi:hypothetical protein